MTTPYIEPRFDELVSTLLAATRAETIAWESGEVEHEFRHAAGSGAVVCGSRDGNGVAPFQLKIYNSRGAMAERWLPAPGSDGAPDPRLIELHTVVRRSVYRVAEVVEELIAFLPQWELAIDEDAQPIPAAAEPRLETLLDGLITAVRDGTIEWEPTDVEDEFRYEGAGGSIACGSRDKDEVAPFVVKIYNSDGVLVEGWVSYYDTVGLDPRTGELHTVVRRSVHRVAETVEDLIAGIPLPTDLEPAEYRG
jgi:hypothetical protein